mmetsp:Transcript_15612/g.31979  ORF Transcript_15612/g.31979 Transcript_15612/m.31979 type:complete len:254 (-) Transcript_15612:150-911(-)
MFLLFLDQGNGNLRRIRLETISPRRFPFRIVVVVVVVFSSFFFCFFHNAWQWTTSPTRFATKSNSGAASGDGASTVVREGGGLASLESTSRKVRFRRRRRRRSRRSRFERRDAANVTVAAIVFSLFRGRSRRSRRFFFTASSGVSRKSPRDDDDGIVVLSGHEGRRSGGAIRRNVGDTPADSAIERVATTTTTTTTKKKKTRRIVPRFVSAAIFEGRVSFLFLRRWRRWHRVGSAISFQTAWHRRTARRRRRR